MTSFSRTVSVPSNTPWISAISISAVPWKAPCSAIWITRESMVASTVPSTTSVSQSVISTPLSLMLGPTVSLLPGESCDTGEAWRWVDAGLLTLELGMTAPEGLRSEEQRLNSSHLVISYAVFCLKKKKITGSCHTRRARPLPLVGEHPQLYTLTGIVLGAHVSGGKIRGCGLARRAEGLRRAFSRA